MTHSFPLVWFFVQLNIHVHSIFNILQLYCTSHPLLCPTIYLKNYTETSTDACIEVSNLINTGLHYKYVSRLTEFVALSTCIIMLTYITRLEVK